MINRKKIENLKENMKEFESKLEFVEKKLKARMKKKVVVNLKKIK